MLCLHERQSPDFNKRCSSWFPTLDNFKFIHMFPTFHQYYPEELYLGIDNIKKQPVEGEADWSTQPINGFRKTGIEILDQFLRNLYLQGLRTGEYHADKLGVEPNELGITIQTLTGMKYSQFASKCILMIAKDLIRQKPKNVTSLSSRLGFESYSGFYRFLKRHTKKTPTGRVNQSYW